MDTKGQHATADMWLKGEYNEHQILVALENMLQKYNVLVRACHYFSPHGLTKVWVLGESHCSLHTYPEANYISIDLYTCSTQYNPVDCLAALKDSLQCKHMILRQEVRGVPCVQ